MCTEPWCSAAHPRLPIFWIIFFPVCFHWVIFPQLISGASWQRMSPAGPGEWQCRTKPQQCHLWSCQRAGSAAGRHRDSMTQPLRLSAGLWTPKFSSVHQILLCGCDWGFPTRGQFYHACTSRGCWSHSTLFLRLAEIQMKAVINV